MIGVVIVTHGRLAHEFRAALEHVVGPQEQVETISIGPDDDLDVRRADMLAALARVDSGDGVVVLTDMFGGSPSNLAISAMERNNVEVIMRRQPADAGQARKREGRMRAHGSGEPGAGGRAEIYQRSEPNPGRDLGSKCRGREERLLFFFRSAMTDFSVKPRYDKGGEGTKGLYFAEVVIPNKKGLHARASAQFVRCASGFNAEVRVTREGHSVGGTSIMGLMMLAAGQGHSILIETEGPEARAAMEALIALVEAGFHEED